MALLQAAVFWYAGSYVIRPKSSSATLILRRSIALMAPSWTGSSYCLPVRLSVIVIVSGIPRVGRVAVCVVSLARVGAVGVGRLAGDAVVALEPAGEVQQAAAFAA